MYLWIRRAWQVLFLGLFLALVVGTSASLIAGYPVWWFLAVDPLPAVGSALAHHSLNRHLLWALPLIVLTLVFGRFFCGWMCPLGTLNQAIGWLRTSGKLTLVFRRDPVTGRRSLKLRHRPMKPVALAPLNAPRPVHRLKYLILVALLAMAALGSLQIGLLDPISTTWRGLTASVLPALGNAFGIDLFSRHFQFGALVTLLFATILALNLVYPRFFCRVLCPLGALLGLLARFSLFRITKKPGMCKDCDACGASCQGAADPQGTVRVSECMVCLSCTVGCPRNALEYRFMPAAGQATGAAAAQATSAAPDLGRRRLVGAAVAGLAAVPLMRATAAGGPRPDPAHIRPPGALAEPDFLSLCVKCGACMKACPTNGLQPAFGEAGLEGLWSPVLVPRIGYCEQACVLCSRVCPTGAIGSLTIAEKLGAPPAREPMRIGSAAIDRGRCLPWANDTPCIVCEEVCPTSPKAVYFKLETVIARDGSQRTLQRPHVDLARCWGCGVCEARCPIFDRAAIRVSSVGESRSRENRSVLRAGSSS